VASALLCFSLLKQLNGVAAPVGRSVEPAQALAASDAAVDLVDPLRDRGFEPRLRR
jgi:hypothetical protein